MYFYWQTARPGQLNVVQDTERRTAKRGQLGPDSQERSQVSTEQPGKDIHNRTSRNGSQTRIEQSGHEPLKYLTK